MLLAILVFSVSESSRAEDAGAPVPLSFGVTIQRSPVLTAEYWNPLLAWISSRSGVPLRLRLGKSGEQTSGMVQRGEFDFVYTNLTFLPGNQGAGYRAIARPAGPGIRGQLVVLEDSPVRSLDQLRGAEVAFPHRHAFAAYFLAMGALQRAGIDVKPVFAGNQEGAIGQLRSRRVAAAAVNSQVMRDFAERESLPYRVLWSSEEQAAIPISAHPRVPSSRVRAVQEALLAMSGDPEGARMLQASASLLKQPPPYGFVHADDAAYDSARRLYRGQIAGWSDLQ